MENIFDLTSEELKDIANNLQKKIEEGLKKDATEILGLPTHIHPLKDIKDAKVLVLDWGGTNFRAAIVEFKGGKAKIIESLKEPLSANETVGFKSKDLLDKMTSSICKLKKLNNEVTQIGYCFSYPAESLFNGDAKLLRWTKGIDIPEMIGEPVGKPLLDSLNNNKDISTTFTDIKVINDTVACLFAGLTEVGYDAYIGLIVGTGTNMAALMHLSKIEKLNNRSIGQIPVNLESGNFYPPYLTVVDDLVDAMSDNKGSQRFEKSISGKYLGEIFKTVFSDHKIKYNFDGEDLTKTINNPNDNPKEYVSVANWIYNRSAKLVSASLAGLAQVLVSQDKSIKKIYLAADGSVFWSNDYCAQVTKELENMLGDKVSIVISQKEKMTEPNLIGSAMAALS